MDLLLFNGMLGKLKKKVKDTFDYSFILTSNADYLLTLTYEADGDLLASVYKQVAPLIPNAELKGTNPDLITVFEIPKELLARVHTTVIRHINQVLELPRKDGIDPIRSSVESCTFKRTGDKMNIIIKVVGVYVRRQ